MQKFLDDRKGDITVEKKKYKVSFYGEMIGNCQEIEKLKNPLKDSTKGYLRGLCDAQAGQYSGLFTLDHMPDYVLEDLVEKLPLPEEYRKTDNDKLNYYEYLILPVLAFADRTKILRFVVAKSEVDAFGLDCSVTLDNFHDHGDEEKDFLTLCNESEISLIIPKRTIPDMMSEEVLTAILAGNFVLAPFNPAYLNFFPEDSIIFYMNFFDAQEKIEYYLAHLEEREKIAENGQKIVQQMLQGQGV